MLKLKPSKRNKLTKQLVFLGGNVPFSAKLTKGTWSDDWADDGVTNAVKKNSPVPLTVNMTFNGADYSATITALLTSNDKGAKFKK